LERGRRRGEKQGRQIADPNQTFGNKRYCRRGEAWQTNSRPNPTSENRRYKRRDTGRRQAEIID
jgi:hypothetical protein